MGNSKEPLEYHSASKGRSVGWTAGLVVAIVILVPVAALNCLGAVVLGGLFGGGRGAGLLGWGTVIILGVGIFLAVFRKSYAPLAIFLTAGCLFVLLMGVCGRSF